MTGEGDHSLMLQGRGDWSLLKGKFTYVSINTLHQAPKNVLADKNYPPFAVKPMMHFIVIASSDDTGFLLYQNTSESDRDRS